MNRRPLLALALLLPACTVLPDRPYIETRRYPLDPRREGPRRASLGQALLLRPVGAAAGLDARGLRRIRADQSLDIAPYDEWLGPPAELAEGALRDWLLASGLFPAVASAGTRLVAPLILEAELLRLEVGGAEAHAGLGALLLRQAGTALGTAGVLGQTVTSGTAPVGGTDEPAQAAAMRAALGDAFGRLEQWLASRVSRREASRR